MVTGLSLTLKKKDVPDDYVITQKLHFIRSCPNSLALGQGTWATQDRVLKASGVNLAWKDDIREDIIQSFKVDTIQAFKVDTIHALNADKNEDIIQAFKALKAFKAFKTFKALKAFNEFKTFKAFKTFKTSMAFNAFGGQCRGFIGTQRDAKTSEGMNGSKVNLQSLGFIGQEGRDSKFDWARVGSCPYKAYREVVPAWGKHREDANWSFDGYVPSITVGSRPPFLPFEATCCGDPSFSEAVSERLLGFFVGLACHSNKDCRPGSGSGIEAFILGVFGGSGPI